MHMQVVAGTNHIFKLELADTEGKVHSFEAKVKNAFTVEPNRHLIVQTSHGRPTSYLWPACCPSFACVTLPSFAVG